MFLRSLIIIATPYVKTPYQWAAFQVIFTSNQDQGLPGQATECPWQKFWLSFPPPTFIAMRIFPYKWSAFRVIFTSNQGQGLWLFFPPSFLVAVRWLRLVGSIKTQVSFKKEPYKRDLYSGLSSLPIRIKGFQGKQTRAHKRVIGLSLFPPFSWLCIHSNGTVTSKSYGYTSSRPHFQSESRSSTVNNQGRQNRVLALLFPHHLYCYVKIPLEWVTS